MKFYTGNLNSKYRITMHGLNDVIAKHDSSPHSIQISRSTTLEVGDVGHKVPGPRLQVKGQRQVPSYRMGELGSASF
ncbi:hypothetical protein P691DRAFT_808367, partial [Macrolepiota fuliginosa MF-IS2]